VEADFENEPTLQFSIMLRDQIDYDEFRRRGRRTLALTSA